MKFFLKSLKAQKRNILIFLLAVILPLLTVFYISFDTFFERKESRRRLLESNLLITSRSVMTQLEDELIAMEFKILSDPNFQDNFELQTFGNNKNNLEYGIPDNYFKPFVLNNEFKIIFPQTGDINYNNSESFGRQFRREYNIAEEYEYKLKEYSTALNHYEKCVRIATRARESALALEAMARLSRTIGKYKSSYDYYKKLHDEFPKLINEVGHPYSVISLIQMAELSKMLGKNTSISQYLIEDYKKLNGGYWKINRSSFYFLKSELKRVFENQALILSGTDSGTVISNLLDNPSTYEEDLNFSEFLKKNVVNRIKQTVFAGEFISVNNTKRIVIQNNGEKRLISYKEIGEYSIKEDWKVQGIEWKIDTLKDNIIQSRIDKISLETDLNFSLISNDNINNLQEIDSSNSVSLPFTRFELPWKLLIVQPVLMNLDSEIRNDTVILGIFLFVIIVFMITGIFLFVRDFRRESEIMNTKTEFMHNVSHELKTPLSLIRLYGETMLIKDNMRDDDKRHALEVITKESERLSHMINNILDFSKIEMGRKEFHFRLGNFHETIKETIDSYSYHLKKKGFSIITEIKENIPQIEFDREAIEGLLINMLSNAIKYSEKEKELKVSLTFNEKIIILTIADKGIGIPANEISNIFKRFYRSNHTSKSEVRGSGLGLTLVKHVVDAHNGQVSVQSSLGEGSVFTFMFPIPGLNSGDIE